MSTWNNFKQWFVKAKPEKLSRSKNPMIGVVPQTEDTFSHLTKPIEVSVASSLWMLMKASPTVYACMVRYLHAVSPVRFCVKEKIGDNKYKEVENHPFELLLAYPNPHQTGGELKRRLVQHLLACGNAYLRKIRDLSGNVIQLYIIDPSVIKAIPDPSTYLKGYQIGSDHEAIFVPFEDIIHFQLENPETPFCGLGIVQANCTTIASDKSATEFWLNTIQKSVRKNGILSFKHDPSDEEIEDADTKLRQDVIGAWNAGGIMILGQEHTFTDLSKNTQDVDYTEARSALREYLASVFSVPAPMVGILDNSTYNNLQVARMIFWLDTILPFLEMLCSTLTRTLFYQEEQGDARYKYVIGYDVSSVEALYYVFGQKLDLALKLFKLGISSKEIVKQLQLGIDENACSDFGFLPSSMSTVENLEEAEAEEEPELPQTRPNRTSGIPSEEENLNPKRPQTTQGDHVDSESSRTEKSWRGLQQSMEDILQKYSLDNFK